MAEQATMIAAVDRAQIVKVKTTLGVCAKVTKVEARKIITSAFEREYPIAVDSTPIGNGRTVVIIS